LKLRCFSGKRLALLPPPRSGNHILASFNPKFANAPRDGSKLLADFRKLAALDGAKWSGAANVPGGSTKNDGPSHETLKQSSVRPI
jgi:hypothetical protein